MKTCPQCNSPLDADAPEGLCPRCLASAAIHTAATRISDAPGATPADLPDIGNAADVGARLPQYEIMELLGQGGMGVVYKARQKQLDRVVALKILPPADALSPDFVARFRREAQSLAKLNHPNIVAIHDFGESGGLYYFAMEFVDGVNLREMIRTGKMKPEEALAVVPKICDALQFAHEEGVVHRDVKPENILIDKRGRVKIADFGLAKLLRREQADHTLTMTGMTLGTPRYMAPEQLDKPETVDHRADIYSLGVVFYEMLTGEVPMGRFAPPSEKVRIDVRLDEIVLHALERDADRRYQHVSQVRDDVEKVTSSPKVAQVSPPASPAALPDATAGGTPAGPTDWKSVPHTPATATFLRSMLWLTVIVGAVMFIWFEKITLHGSNSQTTIRIGAVQPWLILGDRLISYAPNFLTVSGLAGIGALVAGIALACIRRPRMQGSEKSGPELLAQINARGIEVMIAGIALALGAFISFLMACDYNVYSSDKSGALALALVSMVSFAAGLAALIAGIFMRRVLFPRSVIAIAWLLCALPAAAFVVKLPLLKVLFLPLTFAAFAGVRTLIAMKRAELAPSDAENRWRALRISVAVSGFVAAGVMLLWGIFATCTGPGVPPRTDMLAWLPYAFALVGAIFLLAKSSGSRHPASSDTLPETVLAALGAGVAALPWRWLEKPIPNPWSLAVGSGWESSEGASFSLVYLVFGILLFITGGRRSHSAIRPALTLLTGIVALALLRHFVTHFPQPNGPGGWGYMDHLTKTIYPSLRYQSTFVAAVITALLTTLVGVIQLRNRANAESEAGIPSGISVSNAARTAAEPRLSRLALWGAILAAQGFLIVPPAVFLYWKYHMPEAWEFLLLGLAAFSAVGAVFGTTICGAIAVAQIKRSGGKLYGLPLAAIALLIHPLAALGSGAFLLLRMAYSAATRNWLWIPSTQEYPPTYAYSHFIEAFNVVGILAALLVCFFAGRAAWRKISGVIPQPKAPRAPGAWTRLEIAAVATTALAFVLGGVNALFDLARNSSPMHGATTAAIIAAAACSAALMIAQQFRRPANARAALPGLHFTVLAACTGSLPWTQVFSYVTGWNFWHGAAFAALNFVLALTLLITAGGRGATWRGIAMLLAGLAGLALVLWWNAVPVTLIGDRGGFLGAGSSPMTINRKPALAGAYLAAALAVFTAITGALRLRSALATHRMERAS